jgi:hypothetical protein
LKEVLVRNPFVEQRDEADAEYDADHADEGRKPDIAVQAGCRRDTWRNQ